MNRISVILSILILSTLCFYSCKSSKSSVEGESTAIPNVTLQEMAQSYTDWNTYSTSGKLTLSGAASFSTSIQVKMTHNKSISISIRPVLGIEVAKVFVDNDSAVVIDKLHRVYTTIELERFKHILPVNIGNIQDIMLARPFTINDGTLSTDNTKKFNIHQDINGFMLSPRKTSNGIAYQFAINANKQVEQLIVSPTNSAQSYTAVYSDFATDNAGSEASRINFDATLKGKNISVQLYLNPSKTKWDSFYDESISISSSYRKVTLMELIEILKSM